MAETSTEQEPRISGFTPMIFADAVTDIAVDAVEDQPTRAAFRFRDRSEISRAHLILDARTGLALLHALDEQVIICEGCRLPGWRDTEMSECRNMGTWWHDDEHRDSCRSSECWGGDDEG